MLSTFVPQGGQQSAPAAMSLTWLWQQPGERTKVYALLAPIYVWFTEGFDTADLQETRTLLED